MDWKGIETAPRDGTPILGWDGKAMAVVVWSTLFDGDWCLCVAGEYAEGNDWNPSMWAPISPPND